MLRRFRRRAAASADHGQDGPLHRFVHALIGNAAAFAQGGRKAGAR